ncbi:MAG: sulfite exporter TauE/SafE family protein [Bacteroidales bacterium]|nr:sulfite exporter TauE/SafE family protein [Bacteroidales bacterium]
MPEFELSLINVILLLVVGVFCGFINTLAGSGSFISLPLLMFMGLPAAVANGTNRIGILFQNIVSSRSFYKNKMLPLGFAFKLAIPSILGSILGAKIAVEINQKTMEMIIGVIMLIMLFFIFYKPNKWLKPHTEKLSQKIVPWHYIVFFFIGIYGGFIQAGVGIFLLSALVLLLDVDLIRSNAIKVFINLIFTPFALFVFIINNQVDYSAGLILAIGNMAGAYIATKSAIKKGAPFVRWILLIVIISSAIKLLFFP